MTFERDLWKDGFSPDSAPEFPCPHCDHGRLLIEKDTLKIIEPEYSKSAYSVDGWEPDWMIRNFSMIMQCNIGTCKEAVIFSGVVDMKMYAGEDDWEFLDELRPRAVFPAPPIIKVDDGTPDSVIILIKQSFSLFWTDLAACGNRLRTSVETVLDELKIPRQGTSNKGKSYDLNISQRIDEFKKINPNQAPTLDALRVVGNVGSHDRELARETVLDAYQIYEDALAEIFGGRTARIDEIRKKILASRGKS